MTTKNDTEIENLNRIASPISDRPKAPYVRYLEGLRGLAALDVTLYHIWGHTLNSMPMLGWNAVVRNWMGAALRGRVAVDVFIVLSGYLLMRPASRSPDGKLPGGMWKYLQRRAWRILPPYYAALLLALGLEVTIPALRTPLSVQWNDSLPPFGTKNLLAHLFMVHNLSYHWASKIDSPMWTVATEWQIYFVFPLLLLPIWRRFGSWASMAVGLVVGLGCYFSIGGHAAAPWFIGLFAFGMAAAARERGDTRQEYDRRLFGLLTAGLIGLYALFGLSIHLKLLGSVATNQMQNIWESDWPMDILIGAATACLLAFAAAARETPNWLVKALSTRWLVQIGVVSYSLYLIHDPLLAVMKMLLKHMALGPYEQLSAMVLIGLPLVMVLTYAFHLIFEKPFMSARRVYGAKEPDNSSILQSGSKHEIGRTMLSASSQESQPLA